MYGCESLFSKPHTKSFFGKISVHQNHLTGGDIPTKAVGYMRKQEFERMKATSPPKSSKVQPLVGVANEIRRVSGPLHLF